MRRSTLVFPVLKKYDVFELKNVYAKNFGLGMAIAVLIHILFVGVYYFIWTTAKSVESKPTAFTIALTQAPSINIPMDQQIAVSSPGTSKYAIPIPVPDDKAVDEKLIPTQKDLSSMLAQSRDAAGGIVKVIPPAVNNETPKEEIPDIRGFTIYEKAPEIIESVAPVYPELARRSGLEGTVYVRVLIGKNGRPLKAVAVKFDSEIFVKP